MVHQDQSNTTSCPQCGHDQIIHQSAEDLNRVGVSEDIKADGLFAVCPECDWQTPETEQAHKPVCPDCGGENLLFEGNVEWDVEAQAFIPASKGVQATCCDCDYNEVDEKWVGCSITTAKIGTIRTTEIDLTGEIGYFTRKIEATSAQDAAGKLMHLSKLDARHLIGISESDLRAAYGDLKHNDGAIYSEIINEHQATPTVLPLEGKAVHIDVGNITIQIKPTHEGVIVDLIPDGCNEAIASAAAEYVEAASDISDELHRAHGYTKGDA